MKGKFLTDYLIRYIERRIAKKILIHIILLMNFMIWEMCAYHLNKKFNTFKLLVYYNFFNPLWSTSGFLPENNVFHINYVCRSYMIDCGDSVIYGIDN